MLPFLALHAAAASRGDGLHPLLLAKLLDRSPRAPSKSDRHVLAAVMPKPPGFVRQGNDGERKTALVVCAARAD